MTYILPLSPSSQQLWCDQSADLYLLMRSVSPWPTGLTLLLPVLTDSWIVTLGSICVPLNDSKSKISEHQMVHQRAENTDWAPMVKERASLC